MIDENCISCMFSGWKPFGTHHSFFNVVCKKMNDKIIKEAFNMDLDDDDDLIAPSWCPKKITESQSVKHNQSMLEKWQTITPKIKWENIKKDKVYHIPPYNSQERTDIKIISIQPTFLRYQKIKSNVIGTLYPSQIAAKIMVEKHS